jgi:solute carrier family 36 (proton-coupled amino acid transporter)
MISIGVILGFAIQFFIPIQIMFPGVRKLIASADRYPVTGEMFFRIFMVLVTFTVALLVPNLGLLISLIGAVCSTSLALVFPTIIEYLVVTRDDGSIGFLNRLKMVLILLLAIVGFLSGGRESVKQIMNMYA